jgi:hypothetical protein
MGQFAVPLHIFARRALASKVDQIQSSTGRMGMSRSDSKCRRLKMDAQDVLRSSESSDTFIAARELTAIDSAGREFPVKLAIGQPYQVGSDWRCAVLLEGFLSIQPRPYGVDSFQALMLAQRLARQYLTSFVEERAGRLLDSPGGNTVSVDALFGGGLTN